MAGVRSKTIGYTLSVAGLLIFSSLFVASNVFGDSPNLLVDTKDDSGNSITGYWVAVQQSGSLIQTGYSPSSFTLPAGDYQVEVADYGIYAFKQWSDGTTARFHPVTIGSTGSVSLTAI